MKIMKFCEECGEKGGTVPKHNEDGTISMLHEECAQLQMFRYMARHNQKAGTL